VTKESRIDVTSQHPSSSSFFLAATIWGWVNTDWTRFVDEHPLVHGYQKIQRQSQGNQVQGI
jgi:hypothetical protein